VGGVGAIWTKPIAVIDPDNRKFENTMKIDFNVGIGLRVFFNRWFAVNLELRDYIYNEKLEATTIAKNERDSSTWYGQNSLTNNVQAQLGISLFLPPSWEYRLPK
jgi:outer membrane beta-barrel protein